MSISITHRRGIHFLRFAVLTLCVIGTTKIERDSFVWAQTAAISQIAVTTGELLVEPPTLINPGFEWFIEGDDNRNAAVAVSFRKQGDRTWSTALPLMRLQGEQIVVGA